MVPIEDAAYFSLFHVARLEDVRPDSEPVPAARFLDERHYRILAPGELRMAAEAESPATRGDSTCNNIAYNNQPGVFALASIHFPYGFVDDCRLPAGAVDSFICSASVTSGGSGLAGGSVYQLTISVYSDCPDSPRAALIASGSFADLPDDGLARTRTIDVSPDYRDADDIVWVGAQSNSPGAMAVIAGKTTDPGDLGTTANSFAIPDGTQGCDSFVFGGGSPPWGGLAVTLRGSAGPMGCCCDTLTGVKSPTLAGACGSYTQSWSATDCASAPPCNVCSVTPCPLGGPGNLENEPDCTTNYVDGANRGCAERLSFDSATEWTTLAGAPAMGCGRTGGYSFLNGTFTEIRRDQDTYLLTLTQDSVVTWKVRGNVAMEAIVGFTLRQTSAVGPISCGVHVTTASGDQSIASAPACEEALAHACLPGRPSGFRYMLIARPTTGVGVPCGGAYYQWDVTTQPCTFAASGACCTPTGCIQTSPLACLIGFNQYQGDGSDCSMLAEPCAPAPANDLCTSTKIIFSNTVDVRVSFDTTFANTDGLTYGVSGQVFKDVWFEYRIPTITSATTGRLAVSTIGTCFNSKLALLQVRNLSQPDQTIQCSSTGAQSALLRGFGTPVVVTAIAPPLPLAGFTYVRSSVSLVSGLKFKIRVGGISEGEFGPGMLGISWIPDATFGGGTSWDLAAGRCCLPGGGCIVAPADLAPPASDSTPDNCLELGGYLTNVTDFQQGTVSEFNSEYAAVGCGSLPCPAEGEACWNAVDFNAQLGEFGTLTRAMLNALYVKYTVPATTTLGSGISVDTCGSLDHGVLPLDTSIAVYQSFNVVTGECGGFGASFVAQNERCGPDEASAAPAEGLATCYSLSEPASCLCFRVVDSAPGPGELQRGQTYWIALGARNNIGGSRSYIDPVRNDCRAEGPVTFTLRIANPAECFTCQRPACVGTPENEPACTANYVDQTNAGCSMMGSSYQLFRPITPDQTVCGESGTYRTTNPCLYDFDCGVGENCNTQGIPGTCQGTVDNSRDVDFYRVVLTAPQRLSWQISADFPAAIQLIAAPMATSVLLGDPSDTDSCIGTIVLAAQTNLNQCSTSVVQADVCAGVYYLSVTVAWLSGTPCSGPRSYSATLLEDDPTAAASACCKGDLNNDSRMNGADIQSWIDELLRAVVPENRAAACFAASTCGADFTNDYLVTIDDVGGLVTALVGKSACPATACGDRAAGHLPSSIGGGAISELSGSPGGSQRTADDFHVSSAGGAQQIDSLCWWGFYFDFAHVVACAAPMTDIFTVSIYADAGGVPGSRLAPPFGGLSITRTDLGVDLDYLGRQIRRFKYEAALPAPVPVVSGGCYWLEIVHQSTDECVWLWESSSSGNGVTVQRQGGPAGKENWSLPDRLSGGDQAWCLGGIRVASDDCGLPLGRCCAYPSGACVVTVEPDCAHALGSRWTPFAECAGGCPVVALNDACSDAILITANAIYTGSTMYATRDLDSVPAPCELSCGSNCNTSNDVWYRWVNNDPAFGGPVASMRFSMCYTTPPSYDSIMAVYDACPTQGGKQVMGGCAWRSCAQFGPSEVRLGQFQNLPEPTGVPPFCTPGIDCYRTYYIRVSGWGGANGPFTLRVLSP